MSDQTTAATADDHQTEPDPNVRTRTRTRNRTVREASPNDGEPTDRGHDLPAAVEEAPGDGGKGDGGSGRRRRRGGRRRRSADETPADGQPTSSEPPANDADMSAEDREVGERIASSGTRVTARRHREVRTRAPRDGRRPDRTRAGGVPEEVRRAILEGPPRTMVITTSDERTQIAVLEDRTVVEHYVTRKEDVSYVGNVYMARVQNVLPGMEAAFLDIGKGRNGVLYAGEVLYDELDLEEGETVRIETALKPGQTVMVQVTKDPMGSKGARLTMHPSLAGRYLVLAPLDTAFGISRKLTDAERERLRAIMKRIRPEGMGVIVRTAASEATEEQLEEDLGRLVSRWRDIEACAAKAKALQPVHEEPGLVVRAIRDVFGPEFVRIVVDTQDVYDEVSSYLEAVMADQAGKLELYEPPPVAKGEERPLSLFEAYHVAEQLRKALDRKVWLPSGGYLIIDRTEAMTIVDVNTGRYVGSTNLEETVLKTNLEAAEEIVRQLRLRDIGGMIIIDFIDMLLKSNQDQVIRRLKRELLRDRTKTRVSEVSRLGLVQMTRKNVSQGLVEAFTDRCETCQGQGRVVTFDVAG